MPLTEAQKRAQQKYRQSDKHKETVQRQAAKKRSLLDQIAEDIRIIKKHLGL